MSSPFSFASSAALPGTSPGAAAAAGGAPAVVWAGDGGAMQGIVEVSTAVRHRLPLILVVLNDGCYGAEYLKLQSVGSQAETSFVEWPSFAEVARSLGAHGVRVTDSESLAEAVDAVRSAQYPLVVEVVADPHRMVNHPSVAPLS